MIDTKSSSRSVFSSVAASAPHDPADPATQAKRRTSRTQLAIAVGARSVPWHRASACPGCDGSANPLHNLHERNELHECAFQPMSRLFELVRGEIVETDSVSAGADVGVDARAVAVRPPG
jgi:hypothetical protein